MVRRRAPGRLATFICGNPITTVLFYICFERARSDGLLGKFICLNIIRCSIGCIRIPLLSNPSSPPRKSNFMRQIDSVVIFALCKQEGGKPKMHMLVKMCCGPSSWLVMHVSNDWLATCWFFFWLTLMWVLGDQI